MNLSNILFYMMVGTVPTITLILIFVQ